MLTMTVIVKDLIVTVITEIMDIVPTVPELLQQFSIADIPTAWLYHLLGMGALLKVGPDRLL